LPLLVSADTETKSKYPNTLGEKPETIMWQFNGLSRGMLMALAAFLVQAMHFVEKYLQKGHDES